MLEATLPLMEWKKKKSATALDCEFFRTFSILKVVMIKVQEEVGIQLLQRMH